MKKVAFILSIVLTLNLCPTAWSWPSQTPIGSYEQTYIIEKFPGMDKPYSGPLPWRYNPKFALAVKQLQTKVLMASYKATLHDPILAEGFNISLAADQLAGTVIAPGETFSQNAAIGPYSISRGYKAGPTYMGNQLTTTVGGGVCKIATMLYNVATFSNLPIVMRFPHSMTVPYVPPGQDATVYYGAKDVRFTNNTGGPILIWSQKVGSSLYMAFYGQKKPPKVTWQHKILKKIDFWQVKRFNPLLPTGSTKTVTPGQEGFVVQSWVVIEHAKGGKEIKPKGKSYYNPSPCIVEYGPKQAPKTPLPKTH